MVLLSSAIVDFYLFYDGAVDMQILNMSPSEKKSEFLILRWLLRPVGLMLFTKFIETVHIYMYQLMFDNHL